MLPNVSALFVLLAFVISLYPIVHLSQTIQAISPSKATRFRLVALFWFFLQSTIAYLGFYLKFPIKPLGLFVVGILPTVLFIVYTFLKQKELLTALSLEKLTWLHTIRIPVEIGLFYLFLAKAVPQEMTFEGHNFDILAGLTAPLVAYFGIRKGLMSRNMLLAWNGLCLLLLANIVITAALSVSSPFQVFGHSQPNIAVLYAPAILLPTLIVPSVLFAHLVCIMQLWTKK